MDHTYDKYMEQATKAKEIVVLLENELHYLRMTLEGQPNNANVHQEIRRKMLDLTITNNELEHCQSVIERRMSQIRKIDENKYY